MDQTQGHPHTDSGNIHIYFRPEVSDHPSERLGRLDPSYKVGPAEGRRNVRVPSVHAAGQELLCEFEHCWSVY